MSPQLKIKPPKPSLTIQKQSKGGICLNKINTQKLAKYIVLLESSY